MIKQAMILSAGEGKRMRPLSKNCPKPLLPLGEKRIIDHVITMLNVANINKISLNIHQHQERFINLDHITKFQEYQLLDSGGGVNNMLNFMLPDPFFCVNGDTFISTSEISILQQMGDYFDMANMDCLMLLCHQNQVVGDVASGDYNRDQDGLLTRADDKDGDYFYCGIQIINPVVFHCQYARGDIFSMRDIWDRLQENNRLYGLLLPQEQQCYHIGTPSALQHVEQQLYYG